MERNVVQNLNALEELISDAKRRKARATSDEAVVMYVFLFLSPFFLPPSVILLFLHHCNVLGVMRPCFRLPI